MYFVMLQFGIHITPCQFRFNHSRRFVNGHEDLIISIGTDPRELGKVDPEVVLVRHGHVDPTHLGDGLEDLLFGQIQGLLDRWRIQTSVWIPSEKVQDSLMDLIIRI